MARDAPGAPLSSFASSSIICVVRRLRRDPRPPDTTIAASSSLRTAALLDVAVVDDSAALVAPDSGAARLCTVALPPDGSAANDFGRTTYRYGAAPVNVALTIVAPPKMAC